MLSNVKEQLTPELREELAREFEGVLAESHGIAATHLFDQSVQRVVLTLPRNYVHVAKFCNVSTAMALFCVWDIFLIRSWQAHQLWQLTVYVLLDIL